MPNAQSLPLLLKELKLTQIAAHFETVAQTAQEQQLTYADYLACLCEKEIAHRHHKRLQRYLSESKLPPGKTFTHFDFKAADSLNKSQLLALAENAGWVQRAENLILFGASGVGKTHLAAAIGHALIAQGIRCFFTSTTHLVQQLQVARHAYRLPEAMAKLARFPLLILDDIGYVKKDELETSVLFELIADRYETGSLIITANQPFAEWDKIFPDNMMAVAAIDRLIHHATVIHMQHKSFRQSQAKQQLEIAKKKEVSILQK